jgi:CheY-like chemotaxis protein
VTHIRQEFAHFAQEYQAQGLAVVAINSNDTKAFPDDGPAGMKSESASAGYTFPYLFDESQHVAKAFRAACTPDLFLFDYHLPDMTGLQLYDQLHAQKEFEHIPAILMSAQLPGGAELESRQVLGLSKPFRIKQLLELINLALLPPLCRAD